METGEDISQGMESSAMAVSYSEADKVCAKYVPDVTRFLSLAFVFGNSNRISVYQAFGAENTGRDYVSRNRCDVRLNCQHITLQAVQKPAPSIDGDPAWIYRGQQEQVIV